MCLFDGFQPHVVLMSSEQPQKSVRSIGAFQIQAFSKAIWDYFGNALPHFCANAIADPYLTPSLLAPWNHSEVSKIRRVKQSNKVATGIFVWVILKSITWTQVGVTVFLFCLTLRFFDFLPCILSVDTDFFAFFEELLHDTTHCCLGVIRILIVPKLPNVYRFYFDQKTFQRIALNFFPNFCLDDFQSTFLYFWVWNLFYLLLKWQFKRSLASVF